MPKRKCYTRKPIRRPKRTCKTRRSAKITGEEYDPAGNPIYDIPEDDYYEGVPEPRDPLGWGNAPDIPEQHNEIPIVEIKSKPLNECTPKERKKEAKKIATFKKIKSVLDSNPKFKGNEPTIKMAYNGIPIDIPVSMIPKDQDFISKYGDKIKNALIAAGALGALAFGGKKIWNVVDPYVVQPIVTVAKLPGKAKSWWGELKESSREFTKKHHLST